MTVERIDPLDLLDCARLLAGDDDARAPTSASLRRATSSAYYAVFHQVTVHGARWMSHHDDVAEENTVTRWFSHTSIDRAARLVVKMESDPNAGGQSGTRQLFPSLAGSLPRS